MVFGLMALALLSSGPSQAQADVIILHQADTDPTTENFGLWPYNGGITTMPVAGEAWQITNTGSSYQQALYSQKGGTGPFYPGGSGLTPQQINDINANGFIMSLQARIIQGPTYDLNGTQKASAAVGVAGFRDNKRFDIGLGSDGQGNTLVILPSLLDFHGGTFFSYTPFGSPLLVPGTDYHLYQLSYDPTTVTAALFVDGVQQVTGYPGAAASGGATELNFGLFFGSFDNATANFALAELDSGQGGGGSTNPEPASLTLLGVGLMSLIGSVWGRQRRTGKGNTQV
jgi:hypothetical protein